MPPNFFTASSVEGETSNHQSLMARFFLIGKFLPAHGSTFGRIPKKETSAKGLPTEQLAQRFRERGHSYVERTREHLIMGQIGALIALTLTIGAFRVNFTGGESLAYVMPDQEVVQMEEIVQTAQIEKPPPPPRPPVPVEVPNDTILDDMDLDLDMTLDLNEAVLDLPPPPAEPSVVEDEEEIFAVVEKMPEIIGGIAELYKHVSYPPIARKSGIEGTVVVQIIVDSNGVPSNPQVVRSAHEILDKAVAGVMKLRFEPARQRARAVSVYMTIPVKFDLN